MLRYAILSSGSGANAYLFEAGGFSFAIDNGLSARQFRLRAQGLGFDPGNVSLLLLTHVHQDHIRGVDVLCGRGGIKLGAHAGLELRSYLKRFAKPNVPLAPGEWTRFGPLSIYTFRTCHDAPQAVSYQCILDGLRITVITDTGMITPEMAMLAAESDLLFLEANYDEEMLLNGPYPPYLKERILSDRGHLSNEAAVALLWKLRADERLPAIVHLCHISDTNNTRDILERAVDGIAADGRHIDICLKGEMRSGTITAAHVPVDGE